MSVPPAAAADPYCATGQLGPDAGDAVLNQLDVRRAQALVRREAPRSQLPIRVAVLDSGVTGPSIPVAGRTTDITGRREVTYYHGTAVAGLIAGDAPVGIAPDAEIVDVRVYDDVDPQNGDLVSTDSLAAGLEWVARNAAGLNIRVANVSLAVEPSPRLRRAVQAVRRADVVVVAAAGNRPGDGAPFDEDFQSGGPGPGEDAATVMFPTGYGAPLVVSANSTADGSGEADPTPYVVMNSATTVAVPTFGAVSYGLDGRACVLEPIGTSWAAAEVSGVLALLFQRYPSETDEQAVARLVNTANGTPDDPTPLTGAGVVQPLEALTRPLDPDRAGNVERTVATARDTEPAVAPDPEVDPLAGTRDDAVWWGLIGGGVLVVALLLRPVLARRRT
ncbi:S8 family serine peptidase [Nocardioides hungaricus]